MNFKEIATSRRAINAFDTERDVTEAELRQMVELAALAPSSYNLQPWQLVVLRDKEQKEKLRELAFGQPKVSEAPVTLMVLADRDGWKEGHEYMERDFREMVAKGGVKEEQHEWFANTTAGLYGNSPDAIQAFANKNAGFFAMSLMYAARELGLHTHPMDGFDHDGVRKAFGIPDSYWVPLLIAVGHLRPGVEIHPPNWRKSYDEIVMDFKA